MTIALVDGDIIAFKSAVAVVDTDDELAPLVPENAEKYADVMIEEWTRKIKPRKIIMCFSDPSRHYFRHDIYPEYKANRKTVERPKLLKHTYDYLKDKYDAIWREGLEADDLLGILGTDPNVPDPVVVSIDKDMLTLPVKFFNPDKFNRAVRINRNIADLNMFKQAMIGDSSDNFKGIPGIGTKKANAIIESDIRNPWGVTLQAFKDNHLSEEYAIQMVQLARILRYGDYKVDTREVKLWHPNEDKWMKLSTPTTTSMEALKQSTTSNKSAEDSKETKQSASQTQSNTSVDTKGKTKRKKTKSKTSTKRSGTVKD